MSDGASINLSTTRQSTKPVALFTRWSRSVGHGLLRRLRHGAVIVIEGDSKLHFGSAHIASPLMLRVHRGTMWRHLVLGGANGAFESYLNGDWECDDLTALIRLFIRNNDAMNATDGGLARIATSLAGLAHALRRNTRGGSRRNIAEHYDLSNEFFASFLDETMNYSSAIFDSATTPLGNASIHKMDRLCAKLNLRPEDHLLEIGTGWGGLALHAASHYGCRVTTTTISQQQYEYASQRVRSAGLEERVTVLLKDYRDLEGDYDKLVSVEMIEAVGHHYYKDFYRTCQRLIRPDGLMLLQAITIRDDLFETARRTVDFIKKYIFPGSCIPSASALGRAMSDASDWQLLHQEDLGSHYALTLAHWRDRFEQRWEEIERLGFDHRFRRLWNLYLAYCEGGFVERHISLVHLLYARPQYRGATVPENLAPLWNPPTPHLECVDG